MAADTFEKLAGRVFAHCPHGGIFKARDWVDGAWRYLAGKRSWSWRIRRGQLLLPAQYTTGTVAVTYGSSTVTGTDTVWTSGMVGRQFRTSESTPIYTILSIDTGAQTLVLTLDGENAEGYGGSTSSSSTYSIWQAYITAPTNFAGFISVLDLTNKWSLNLHIPWEAIDSFDPERSDTSDPRCIAHAHYNYSSSNPKPQFELWPHMKSQRAYPYWWLTNMLDLSDGEHIPYTIPGEVISTKALSMAASWKDPGNTYYDLKLANKLELEAELRIAELGKLDDEIYQRTISYTKSFQPAPLNLAGMDSDWLQSANLTRY